MADGEPAEPRKASEAPASPEKRRWEKVMEIAMESLRQKNAWDSVELSNDKNAIGNK